MGWTVDALWAAARVSWGSPHIWSDRRNSRIRNCPHCRLHPGDRSCRAREEARKGVAVLHREARRIARDVAGIPEPPPAAPSSYKSSATAQWDTSPWRPRHGRRREK